MDEDENKHKQKSSGNYKTQRGTDEHVRGREVESIIN
jgi:hypothetical protein